MSGQNIMFGANGPPKDSVSSLINYAVRMVVPMRREFGRTLDVHHFLHDFKYASEVLEEAKRSENERLREYAQVIEAGLFGPRNSQASTPNVYTKADEVAPPSSPNASLLKELEESVRSTEAEMRERLLGKYTSGLR